MKKHILFVFCFSVMLPLWSQTEIQVLSAMSGENLENAKVYDLKHRLLGTTDKEGKAMINRVHSDSVQIEYRDFTPQIFDVSKEKMIYLQSEIVLDELEVKATEESARNLIKKLIARQKKNHPKRLGSYQYKSYNKFWVDAQRDSVPYIQNPQTKEDSAQNDERKMLKNSMLFLSERAFDHYYKKGRGNKNVLAAARISGIKTPLYEFIALQPISSEFDQDNFNFFFRKFPNPVSKSGMEKYDYYIEDTLRQNGRQQIQVMFDAKDKKQKMLHGYVNIDQENYALARFYAENETPKGSDTYIEMDYVPYKNVWIPKRQFFRLEGQNYNYFVYRDSIATNGDTLRIKVDKKAPTWMNSLSTYKEIKSPTDAENKVFRGYENDVPKSAFTDFDKVIYRYRDYELGEREVNTYSSLDSLGQKYKIDRQIGLLRLLSKGGWMDVGLLDLDLKRLFASNRYENLRFGLSLRTNEDLFERFRLSGSIFYGTLDEAFKYNYGISYLLNKKTYGQVFWRYTDDLTPMGRHEIPIKTMREFLDWRRQQIGNQYYTKERGISVGYQQDFFKNVNTEFLFNRMNTKALFHYRYKDYPEGYEFNTTNLVLASRWAPKEKYVSTETGKFRISGGYPVFYFMYDQGFRVWGGEIAYSRLQAEAVFAPKIFKSRTHITMRGGKLWGSPPMWEAFDGGGSSRPMLSILGRAREGGSSTFETMTSGEFLSDQYLFAQFKQKMFTLPVGKNRKIPFYGLYKVGIGSLSQPEIHYDFDFKEMKKPYQEVGLEVNSVLLNLIGFGFYYRIGDYQYHSFDRDFSVKALITIGL